MMRALALMVVATLSACAPPCPAGFERSHGACVDIDECADGGVLCGANAHCFNFSGGHTCSCDQGFADHGSGCEPRRCDVSNGDCDRNARCEGEGVTLECTCNDGFLGDGSTCASCHAYPCTACNACNDCAQGTSDVCDGGVGVCSASAPPYPGPASCTSCNQCGTCRQGVTDVCGACNEPEPTVPGATSCTLCNSCGHCNTGSTDVCGRGCDALYPSENECP